MSSLSRQCTRIGRIPDLIRSSMGGLRSLDNNFLQKQRENKRQLLSLSHNHTHKKNPHTNTKLKRLSTERNSSRISSILRMQVNHNISDSKETSPRLSPKIINVILKANTCTLIMHLGCCCCFKDKGGGRCRFNFFNILRTLLMQAELNASQL